MTSIIFSGDPIAPGTFTTEATNQDYFPEWIITGSALVDTTAAARSFDQEQWSHAFGISPLAARVDPSRSPGPTSSTCGTRARSRRPRGRRA